MKALRIDLERLRKASRGYREQVAAYLEVDPATVTRKWRGEFKMTLDDLNRICSVIGREPVDFLRTDDVLFVERTKGEVRIKGDRVEV